MNFDFSPEQEQFRSEVGTFIQQIVTPELLEERRNEDESLGGVSGPLSRAFYKRLGEKGYLGVAIPKEYGGQGKSLSYLFILLEELALLNLPDGLNTLIEVAPCIEAFGTKSQKKCYLPRIAVGDVTFAVGYTEPDAGTDLASLQTRAIRDGDWYVINGRKRFCSGAHWATHIWLAARTDTTLPKHDGISLLVVPVEREGITVEPMTTFAGERTNEVVFDDVRVPVGNLVGEENKGWYLLTREALNRHRGIRARHVATTQRLLHELIDYVKNTSLGGERLADAPVIQMQLAELAVDVEIMRLFVLRNVWASERGMALSKEASIFKVWASEIKARVCTVGMEIIGLYGLLERTSNLAPFQGEIAFEYRSAPLQLFGGGTNEIQRNIISREVYNLFG